VPPPLSNPYIDDPDRAVAYDLGYRSGLQDPGSDDTPPTAPELVDVYLEGREAGREQAAADAPAEAEVSDEALMGAFWKGVQFAYDHPGEEPGTPYAEPLLSAYTLGIDTGRSAATGEGVPGGSAGDLVPPYDGPSVGPYIEGSQTWEEYQKGIQELLEPLLHKHMPHIEVEPFEMPVPPGPVVPGL